jgi:hypothetical protein
MARGRMVNKSICSSKKLHCLPDDTCRLLATWTIPHLDVRGVFSADPAIVKSLVFPRRDDVTVAEIAGYLDAIEQAGLIVRFEAKGDVWQRWSGFEDNQAGLRYDRESSEYPQPPNWEPAPEELSSTSPGQVPDKSPLSLKEVKIKSKRIKGEACASPSPRHPAIDVYRTKARAFPDKAQWPAIEAAIPTDESSLSLWGRVVEAYIVQGWNKRNVGGMIEFYKRGEIPGARPRGGNGNGRTPTAPAKNLPHTTEEVEAEYYRLNPNERPKK